MCQLHIPFPPGMDVIAYRAANGNSVTTSRKKIINADTKKEFDLCASCAYVVALVNET